jgi:hypothetical protein
MEVGWDSCVGSSGIMIPPSNVTLGEGLPGAQAETASIW